MPGLLESEFSDSSPGIAPRTEQSTRAVETATLPTTALRGRPWRHLCRRHPERLAHFVLDGVGYIRLVLDVGVQVVRACHPADLVIEQPLDPRHRTGGVRPRRGRASQVMWVEVRDLRERSSSSPLAPSMPATPPDPVFSPAQRQLADISLSHNLCPSHYSGIPPAPS